LLTSRPPVSDPFEAGLSSARPAIEPEATQRESVSAEIHLRRGRVFYGWVIVGCGFAILCVAYGVQFSFGVFMPYISADTGWNRGALSVPYSVYIFVYSALGLISGRLTDRWGPRIVLTTGGCLLASGIMLMSRVTMLWHIYLVLGLLAASGMSAAYVPCNATVVRWFTLKRGLALSITSSGASFGMFIFPPLVTVLIHAYGWRSAYRILGVVVLFAIIAGARFIQRDPESMGLDPDGLKQEPVPLPEQASDIELGESFTLAEARSTKAFWLMNIVFTLTWMVVFMPMVHIVPFAIDMGISPLRAAMTISVIGFAGFAGRLAIGPLSDRFGRIVALGACLLLQGFSFAAFTISSGLMLLYLAAAVFGFSYGGVTALFPALVGDYFGRAEVGSIVGFIFALAGAPAAFGPLIAGYLYAATDSYSFAFKLSAALNLAAFLLLFSLKKPAKPRHSAMLAAG
jgi:MFS transporter, OFA family, oxalate/formate antiporter